MNEFYREIYRQAFKDPDTSFEDLLFEHCDQYIISETENGKLSFFAARVGKLNPPNLVGFVQGNIV